MNYKFLKIASFYPEAIQRHYNENPELSLKSYSEQSEQIMRLEFSWADYHTKYLKELGVHAKDIIGGIPSLTMQWMKENNFTGSLSEALVQQIVSEAPDVILFQDPIILEAIEVNYLRERIKNLKLVMAFKCSPVNKEIVPQLQNFDMVFTCTPGFVTIFSDLGIKSHLLPHAFEADLLSKCPDIPFENREVDFIFSGNIIGRNGFHEERIKLIEAMISSNVEIDILAEVNFLGKGYKKLIRKFLMNLGGVNSVFRRLIPKNLLEKIDIWNKMTLAPAILKRSKAPAYGINMFRAFANSKIVFNAHAEVAGNWAGNIRLFEATGMGSCLVTDYKDNIRDYFEPDVEIVTYRNTEECIEKIKWLLANPEEAKKIAQKGQQRCLRDHTYKNRAELLNKIILENFN